MCSVQNITSASALVSGLPLARRAASDRQPRLQAEVEVGAFFINGLREGQVPLQVARDKEQLVVRTAAVLRRSRSARNGRLCPVVAPLALARQSGQSDKSTPASAAPAPSRTTPVSLGGQVSSTSR